MITFNPDGGDLGRAIGRTTALEMQIIIPHVASMLNELANEELTTKKFKYAFELPTREKELALFVMNSFNRNLPPRVSWYECDGIKLFEMRGPSGGVVTSYICYLVTK